MGRRFPIPLLGLIAMVFALLGAPSVAHAQEHNEVGQCLAEDQVWLLVVNDAGEVLANECVGTPATGTAALEEAGLQIGRDSSSFICSIGGHPAECPATFDGAFWNYYSGTPGEEYAFSQVGSDEAVPAAGTIEAWCYSTAEEGSCTPPYPVIIQDGAEIAPEGVETSELSVTGGTTGEAEGEVTDGELEEEVEVGSWVAWVVGGLVLAIILVMLVIALAKNRANRDAGGDSGPVGGR